MEEKLDIVKTELVDEAILQRKQLKKLKQNNSYYA